MAVFIRQASSHDFEVIFQFISELQNKVFDRDKMKALYLKNLGNTNNIYLVAHNEDDAIGYLSCHIQTLLHHEGKVAEIQEMFVQPAYRSMGVGKLLMNKVKELVKEKGALQLEVTTRVIRKKAIHFYMRESFQDSHKKLIFYLQPILETPLKPNKP